MEKGIYKALWCGMFILCAVLGFLPEQTGGNRILLQLLSLLFFAPPGLLLWKAYASGCKKDLKLVSILSGCSLGLTLVLLVANFLSILAPEAVGNVLFWALVILSTPFVCGQYWFASLFLWAVLLFTGLELLRQLKKKEIA